MADEMNPHIVKRRALVAGFIVSLVALAVIVKLVTLHFNDRISIPPEHRSIVHRGDIRDRNGYILAMSIETDSLYANPEEVRNHAETARAIAAILGVPATGITEKLSRSKKFVWLRRKIDDRMAQAIQGLNLPGIYFRKEYQRVYPQEYLAAHVVGFVGMDNNGLAGIEYSFEDALSGTEAADDDDGVRYGNTVVLTIDRYIQHLAERELTRAVTTHGARQGAVVIQEVKTGRILALAKFPRFDPNAYGSASENDRRSFTVIDAFEPGSTLKIMSLAGLIDRKPAAAGWSFICPGKIDIGDETIGCTGVHGRVSMADIVRYSCNVGVVESTRSIKKQELHDTLRAFGFGVKTGAGLPGESDGILRSVSEWSGLSKYTIAFGHEISATSLQLISAFSTIANQGVAVAPTVIERIERHDGTVIRPFTPQVRGRVIKASTAAIMQRFMRGVVENGTGTGAASRYYATAGKTGTSKKYLHGKGYTEHVVSSFVGVAPWQNPDITILVIIDDPADKLSGGTVATPVFASLVDPVLALRGVAPRGIVARQPAAIPEKMPSFDGAVMPDFRGHRLPATMPALMAMQRKFGTRYRIAGIGTVTGQNPQPGEPLVVNGEVSLRLEER